MNSYIMELKSFASTDMGPVRENNEDCFFSAEISASCSDSVTFLPQGKTGLYILCDGMGGHQKGEVASFTVVNELKRLITSLLLSPNIAYIDNFGELLAQAVKQANDAVFSINISENIGIDERRMGTTVVMAVVLCGKIYIVHVGDSRCYLVNNSSIEQLTEDHCLANQLLKLGVFKTPEDAFRARGAKALTQAVGPREGKFLNPDIKILDADSGSYLVLCSDGLTDVVTPDEIKKIVISGKSNLKRITNKLIKTAYKNSTSDNITIIIVKIVDSKVVSE